MTGLANEEVKEADLGPKPVLVFGRSCDLHAVKRLDQIYLANGTAKDPFYQRRRDLVKFVLIGCPHSFENCFCVDMGANRTTEGYVFSVDTAQGMIRADVPDPEMDAVFAAHGTPEEVTPSYVTENEVHVRIPENVPLSIIKDPLWDEYTTRCINCGRCNYVCPTCNCYTMQDVFYIGCGRCDDVCPEYISFTNIINKVADAAEKEAEA